MIIRIINILIFLAATLVMGLLIYNSVNLDDPAGNDKKLEYAALVYSVFMVFLSVVGIIVTLALIVLEYI